jgi:hypothetical protein
MASSPHDLGRAVKAGIAILVLAVAMENPLHYSSFEFYPGSNLNPKLPEPPDAEVFLCLYPEP